MFEDDICGARSAVQASAFFHAARTKEQWIELLDYERSQLEQVAQMTPEEASDILEAADSWDEFDLDDEEWEAMPRELNEAWVYVGYKH